MELKNKKIIIVSGITIALVLFVSVAFAALSSNLNISFGNVTQNALSWNVGFKGSSVTPTTEGTSTTGLSCGTATITPSTVTISDSTLSKPGDKCTYNLTIQNKGDISANLSAIATTEPTGISCTITNNSTMVCGNITYQLQTTSGTALTTGVILNKKEEYNIKLVVTYSGDALSSTEVRQSNAKFTLTYTQAENRVGSTPEGVSAPVCKRATTLHTEECNREDGGCHETGYYEDGINEITTITYGSLGTSGTLSSGDAFDCDVNGDGTYDSATERFYYVSGLDGDNTSNYATLIYYTNVSGGVGNNIATFPYYSLANETWHGPETAYQQLPSTTQWSNIKLSNQTRQLYSHTGTTMTSEETLSQFTYTGKSSRLLSLKELNAACGISIGEVITGELDNCEYLMEHTSYSTDNSNVNASAWWLEGAHADYSFDAWNINGNDRSVYNNGASEDYGVRPAIEVLKTDIDY